MRGLTLVEIIVVLTIAGIIIGGIWISAASAINGSKKKRLAEQVLTIDQNVRSYLRTATLDTGLFNQTAIDFNLVPADMVKTSGAASFIQGPYKDSAVSLFYASSAYDLTIANLPPNACIDLVLKIAGDASLVSSVGSAAAGYVAPPVNVSGAQQICSPQKETLVAFEFPLL